VATIIDAVCLKSRRLILAAPRRTGLLRGNYEAYFVFLTTASVLSGAILRR
jgi:hypothetical protein